MNGTAETDLFGPDAIRRRAATALRAEPPPVEHADRTFGDHRMTPGLIPHPSPRAAAVLLPLIPRDAGVAVLFTRRSAALPRHAGQVSFPGGRSDTGDADARHTALREAQEEIGIESHLVETLGYLDVYLSASGFRIVPVVGLVDPAARFTLAASEVDEVFEVPLAFLMTRDNYFMDSGLREGIARRFFKVTYGPHTIWGISAGILRNLQERMYP